MIVTQAAVPSYPPPPIPAAPAPAAEAATTIAAEPAAKGATRGLALLSGAAAAVVLAAQEQGAAPAALDLRGRDLRETDLTKLDLRGADLSDTDLSGKDLSGLDFTGATLTGARLDGANLTDATLAGVKAQDASFRGAMLLRTGMDGADLSKTKFNDAFISDMPRGTVLNTLEEQQAGKYFSIKSVDFTNADFSGADIRNGTFRNSTFDGATFGDSKGYFGLADSTAKNASFQRFAGGVSIRGSDVSSADFSNIDGATVSISRSKVDGVSFSESRMILGISDTDVRSVNFAMRNKTLENTSFTNVDMQGMDFGGYTFKRVHFLADARLSVPRDRTDAELSDGLKGTSFAGATFELFGFSGRAMDLNKANFDGARLTRGSFDGGARIDKVKAITDGLSAGRIFYATPGPSPISGASPDSPSRAWSSPADQKIENWLYSLMPPPDRTGGLRPLPSATAADDVKADNAEDATLQPFDLRKALTDAGALDGADADGSPYSYIGDIFRSMRDADDAEPVREDAKKPETDRQSYPSEK